MKLQTDMKAFRAALATVGKVIPIKQVIPILGSIKIATNDNRIMITGSNLDMTVEIEMAADILTEGVTCINHAHLSAFCAAAKTDSVILEADSKAATVRSGKSRIVISPFDPLDFPNARADETDLVAVDRETFVRAIKFCATAAAADGDVRYYLHGPVVLERDGRVQVWGSDGHGLHHADLGAIHAIGGGGILSKEAVQFIADASDKLDSISVMVGPRGWHMRAGPVRAWGKVIEGTFPDCQRIVDGFADWTEFLIAPRDEAAMTLAIATCGADTSAGKSKSLAITASSGGPVVMRGARGAAGIIYAGRAETMTPAKADIGFMVSSALLSNSLSAMSAPEVSLSHVDRDGTSAVRIVPAQSDANCAMTAIIMGMRATSEELADV